MKRMSTYLTAALLVAAGLWSSTAIADYVRYPAGPQSSQAQTTQRESEEAVVKRLKEKAGSRKGGIEGVAMSASFENPAEMLAPVQQRPERIIHRSASSPTTTIYAVAPNSTGSQSQLFGIWGSIDTSADPANLRLNSIYQGTHYRFDEVDYTYQSGAIRDGILYIPGLKTNMVEGNVTVKWDKIDINTGEYLGSVNFGSNQYAFFYSMTYDPVRDAFFGLSVDLATGSGAGGRLIRVDVKGVPESRWNQNANYWNHNLGANADDHMQSIVFNPRDNKIYGLRVNGTMLCWDPDRADDVTDGKISVDQNLVTVAQFDQDENFYCFPAQWDAAPLVYSPRDKAFIGTFLDNSRQETVLYAIDAVTFEAFEIGTVKPTSYIASLHCFDAYAVGEAPDRVENLSVTFEGNSLTGSMSFTMPLTNFDGIAYAAGKQLETKVMVDNKEFSSTKYTIGQKVSLPITLEEGFHTIGVLAYDGKLVGALSEQKVYVGNDAPGNPRNLYLFDNTLTWDAPRRNSSMHGGYVDASKITYDVYNGNEKINTTPITKTEFEIPNPAKQIRMELTVRAVHEGHSSLPSENLSRVLGPGMTLPVEFEPTWTEAQLFEVIDGNEDGNVFTFQNGNPSSLVLTCMYPKLPNDFLLTPKVHLDDVNTQYRLSFNYNNAYANASFLNNLKVTLRRHYDGGEGDDREIYAHSGRTYQTPTGISTFFSVTEPGDYYICFYEYGDNPYKTRGARLSNFKVEKMEGYTTDAPADLQDVTIISAPDGSNKAVISFTAPTKNMKGNDLQAGETITVTASCGENTKSTTVTPGAKGSIELVTPTNGNLEFFLTPENSKGKGAPRSYYGYIGLDVPTPPTNVQHSVSEDNMTLHMTWDAPKVGVNGGYIDEAGLEYPIVMLSSVTYSNVGTTREKEYSFTPISSVQTNYYVGPTAKNRMGQSLNNRLVFEALGRPHETPMVEEFPAQGTSFNYSKWTYNATDECGNFPWDNAVNMNGGGFGDPVVEGGGLFYCMNLGNGKGYGELIAPKASTKGVPKADIVIRYWDFTNATDLELWGRSNKDQTLHKLTTITPSRSRNSKDWKWVDYVYHLPSEMLDCGWIQINVRSIHTAANMWCLMDSYSIVQDVDVDFKAISVTAPAVATVGETIKMEAKIANSGKETASTTAVLELLGDGNVLNSRSVNTGNVRASDVRNLRATFPMLVEYLDYSKLSARVRVDSPNDEVANNNSQEMVFLLRENVLPTVRDLQASWIGDNDTDIQLTWSEPDATYGDFESFECLPAFGNPDKIGQWKNYDLDQLDPFAIASGSNPNVALEWDGYNQPGGWQVIDAEALGLLSDERIHPHSGTRYVLARSAGYNPETEEPKQVSDWLVSPEIEGGGTLSFWMNTVSEAYDETIAIMYSTTGDYVDVERGMQGSDKNLTCGDFKLGRFVTKTSESWEEVTWKIPEDAKYIAFVYRSIGQLGAMLDDITISPKTLQKWNIDSYDVYQIVNGEEVILKEGVKETSFQTKNTDADKEHSNLRFAVKTVVHDNDDNWWASPLSNQASLFGSSVEGVADSSCFVAGAKGYILAGGFFGQDIEVFATDGKLVRKVHATTEREVIDIEPGIYVVNAVGKNVKVIVK